MCERAVVSIICPRLQVGRYAWWSAYVHHIIFTTGSHYHKLAIRVLSISFRKDDRRQLLPFAVLSLTRAVELLESALQ